MPRCCNDDKCIFPDLALELSLGKCLECPDCKKPCHAGCGVVDENAPENEKYVCHQCYESRGVTKKSSPPPMEEPPAAKRPKVESREPQKVEPQKVGILKDDGSNEDITVVHPTRVGQCKPPAPNKKAEYWKAFSEGIDDNNPSAYCNCCGTKLSMKGGGTSTMRRHLEFKHNKVFLELKVKFSGVSPVNITTSRVASSKKRKSKASANKYNWTIDSNLGFLNDIRGKYSHQPTFVQAVEEMAQSLLPLFQDHEMGSYYSRCFLMMTEPERVIAFRVAWMDDRGMMRYNRGWRVEYSSVLGPYKGGLCFHQSVDEGILKFLGFEQIFKNALTGLPLGGGTGGSDFDPKGKSDNEVRNFCKAFMIELFRYLHPSTDVLTGDIGVSTREIGYLYGQYKKLTNKHGEGILTGKSMNVNGTHLKTEATGYGLIYITKIVIEKQLNRPSLKELRCAVSGSGKVAQHAVAKLLQYGAEVITMSDSNGTLVFEDGLTNEDFQLILECKNTHRSRLHTLDGKVSGNYAPNSSPWTLDMNYDIAFPCATQNELDDTGATLLVKNGILGVFEGANLPTTVEAQQVLRDNKIVYLPGKAANAGGVCVDGLEISQNAQKLRWEKDFVDEELQSMMSNIYQQINDVDGATLEEGANRAGFLKVATAMKELGWME